MVTLSNGHLAGFFPKGGNEQRMRSWYMLLFNNPDGEKVISADDFALWRSMTEFEKPEIVEGRVQELKKAGALRAGSSQVAHDPTYINLLTLSLLLQGHYTQYEDSCPHESHFTI